MNELPVGVLPASVMPFSANGQVDPAGIAKLVSWFRHQGCAGIVLAGTNGEGPSLSAVEKRDMVRLAVSIAQNLPIVLGVATASLEEAVWSCESARKSGATAALVLPPAYFRDASEEGVALWYEALLDRTTLPVIAYNLPQRSGFTLTPEFVARLAAREGLAGVKDSSGNAANLVSFAQAAPGRKLYVGDERLLLKALEAGWSGTISGAANVLAQWLAQIFTEWQADRAGAEAKFELLASPLEVLKLAKQPVANKAVLAKLGILDSAEPRLPLVELQEEELLPLWNALKGFAY